MTPSADELDALAAKLDGLCQRRIDPEKFHVEKDGIVRSMRRLAGRLRTETRAQAEPTTVWRNPRAR